MSENKIFKNMRALEKKSLIDRIDAEMQIPKKRVYCFFDNQEYMEYDQNLEDYYKKTKGFHMYTGNKDKIFGYHPRDVFKIIESNDCEHFIWISKEVCDADDAKFSWYYSHELQHLIHYIENPAFCNLSYFLHDTYSGINGHRWPIEVPIEFDCFQKAKKIVNEIFDSNSYHQCIKDAFLKEEYLKFKEMESLMPFDIEKETIRIICEHKDQFKKYPEYMARYNINIDALCSN